MNNARVCFLISGVLSMHCTMMYFYAALLAVMKHVLNAVQSLCLPIASSIIMGMREAAGVINTSACHGLKVRTGPGRADLQIVMSRAGRAGPFFLLK